TSEISATYSSSPDISSDVEPIALDSSVMSRMLKSSGCPGRMRCRSCSTAVICRIAEGITLSDAARTRIWSTLVGKSGGGLSVASAPASTGYGLGCWLGKRWLASLGMDRLSVCDELLWLPVWADVPATLNLMVRHGARRMSSW